MPIRWWKLSAAWPCFWGLRNDLHSLAGSFRREDARAALLRPPIADVRTDLLPEEKASVLKEYESLPVLRKSFLVPVATAPEGNISAFLWSVDPGRLPLNQPYLQKLKYNIAA